MSPTCAREAILVRSKRDPQYLWSSRGPPVPRVEDQRGPNSFRACMIRVHQGILSTDTLGRATRGGSPTVVSGGRPCRAMGFQRGLDLLLALAKPGPSEPHRHDQHPERRRPHPLDAERRQADGAPRRKAEGASRPHRLPRKSSHCPVRQAQNIRSRALSWHSQGRHTHAGISLSTLNERPRRVPCDTIRMRTMLYKLEAQHGTL